MGVDILWLNSNPYYMCAYKHMHIFFLYKETETLKASHK